MADDKQKSGFFSRFFGKGPEHPEPVRDTAPVPPKIPAPEQPPQAPPTPAEIPPASVPEQPVAPAELPQHPAEVPESAPVEQPGPAPQQPEPEIPQPSDPAPPVAPDPFPGPHSPEAPAAPAELPSQPQAPASDPAETTAMLSGTATPEDDTADVGFLADTASWLYTEPAPTVAVPAPPPAPVAPEPKSWWKRLRDGLSRSSGAISGGISALLTKRKLDAATLEDLEDILIQADLGVDVSGRIAAAVGKGRYDKQVSPEEVYGILASEVETILTPVARPLEVDAGKKPFVILMVGVNGSGKTTTIGKLTAKFTAQGRKVMMAAGDTFRAAAIEQLKVWGERTGTPVISREQGADSAGLAFDALNAAREAGSDVLMIDTAGRLQNKAQLMDELAKVVRVIRKIDDTAPHAVLLVLDATVGQNALSQVEIFGKTAGVTGLVMTKLDGTARGGILVAIADKFGLPVHFIGVGEGVDDLEPFSARDFSRAIAGLE